MIYIKELNLGLTIVNSINWVLKDYYPSKIDNFALVYLYKDDAIINNGDGQPLCLKYGIPDGMAIADIDDYILGLMGAERA
jgi:hypothetical protein